jgi:hypothetical protein
VSDDLLLNGVADEDNPRVGQPTALQIDDKLAAKSGSSKGMGDKEHLSLLLEAEEVNPVVAMGMGMSLKDKMDMISNPRGVPDSKEVDPWMRQKQNSWRLIILFQHNFDILMQAVDGYRRGSDIMAPNIIVVDNSNTKEAAASKRLRKIVKEVIKTPKLLNFPELHNFMADVAVEQGLEVFFWAHADNYVLPKSPERDLGKDVVECLRLQINHAPKWGMVLFSYDHLAAFRTQTMAQVPWDPHVFQYGSECDAYGRLREAGYDAKACKVHLSYDMKRVLNITDKMPYEKVLGILDEDKEFKDFGRNKWREKEISDVEQDWRTAMKVASREYLVEKWSKRGCKVRGLECRKPWPYCPNCPAHIPDCFAKTPSKDELKHIYTESRKVFAADPHQPIDFEKFKNDANAKAKVGRK